MISTANYVARKFGVRSAMPGFIAKKLCPSLVFIEPNFEKYSQISGLMKAVIGEYDPCFSSHSSDEVYFDLTEAAGRLVLFSKQPSKEISSMPVQSNFDLVQQNIAAKVDEDFENHPLPQALLEKIPLRLLRIAACAVLGKIRRRVFSATGGLTCSAGE